MCTIPLWETHVITIYTVQCFLFGQVSGAVYCLQAGSWASIVLGMANLNRLFPLLVSMGLSVALIIRNRRRTWRSTDASSSHNTTFAVQGMPPVEFIVLRPIGCCYLCSDSKLLPWNYLWSIQPESLDLKQPFDMPWNTRIIIGGLEDRIIRARTIVELHSWRYC